MANFFEFDDVEYNCALVRNISERKAFEHALKEKTDYLNTILNSEPECVKVINQQGELIDMNRAGLELLKVDTVEEVRCLGLSSFILPQFKSLFQKLHQDVFQGQSRSLEFILKNKQGEEYWVDTHAAPLYDDNGQVKALVAVTRNITERVCLLKKLEKQARTDFLTELPNRRYFLELAQQELLYAKRYKMSLSILMMDIDYFKILNDTYGHKTGDLALQKLAEVCISLLRTSDVIGRMGGEEFAVLLPSTSHKNAINAAERLRASLASTVVLTDSHINVNFSVSIGVATLTNFEMTIDQLLKTADDLLYEAKHKGRNQVIASQT